MLITAAIKANKERDVATFDIPGVYLHTETYEKVIKVLEGPLSGLTEKIDPKIYKKYVTINIKVKPLLYVDIHKDLYGIC